MQNGYAATATEQLASVDLELGLQELEAMEAPDWWSTALGVGAGMGVVSLVGYSAVSIAT
ncbi:daptide-type RiPP [Streptomyces sp. Ac-502]|uniref:daptide-type RiPP n=1 Tax=Streptomyces sp. Ac-502 TaxID=3342801 RepID=UPI00386264B7